MKKFLIFTIILFGLLFLLQINPFYQNKTDKPKPSEIHKEITVQQKIETEKRNESFKKYKIEEIKTALDLLRQTTTVVTKGDKENAFITEINGRKADDSKKEFWSFYINGKMSPVGAGSYLLKNGDKIEWKIEKY